MPPRATLIEQALIKEHELVSHIPLYNQVIPWAGTKKVEIIHRADKSRRLALSEGELIAFAQ